MREEAKLSKHLEDILTLQAIEKNRKIEEECTDFIYKATYSAGELLFQKNDDVENITKDKIGGILLYY